MVNKELYDSLCRALTDYEGNGTEDKDVIDNIDYVIDVLSDIVTEENLNPLIKEVLLYINWEHITDYEFIYNFACQLTNYWETIWDN